MILVYRRHPPPHNLAVQDILLICGQILRFCSTCIKIPDYQVTTDFMLRDVMMNCAAAASVAAADVIDDVIMSSV